jgi:hypothetical protein
LVNAYLLLFVSIANAVLANAYLLSFASIAGAVLANAYLLSFTSIASTVLANAHPLSFVGIIKATNAYPPLFLSIPIVVLEEKINLALFRGLIVAA